MIQYPKEIYLYINPEDINKTQVTSRPRIGAIKYTQITEYERTIVNLGRFRHEISMWQKYKLKLLAQGLRVGLKNKEGLDALGSDLPGSSKT